MPLNPIVTDLGCIVRAIGILYFWIVKLVHTWTPSFILVRGAIGNLRDMPWRRRMWTSFRIKLFRVEWLDGIWLWEIYHILILFRNPLYFIVPGVLRASSFRSNKFNIIFCCWLVRVLWKLGKTTGWKRNKFWCLVCRLGFLFLLDNLIIQKSVI